MYFPVVLLLYYITPKRFRNLLLFVVNLIFYGWGEPTIIVLMLVSISLNYVSGLLIDKFKFRENPNLKAAKATLITSIVINVGLLGYFKYAGFIGDTLNMVMPFLGTKLAEIPLPIGISFYTFQTMSYTIDVYRRDAGVQKNFITFGTYVSLFPQLIAGPIVRYKDVEKQLVNRRESMDSFNEGVKIFIVGLCKKVLLANQMGKLWDTMRDGSGSVGLLAAWVGIIAYALQIYFDFCGYSEMAIGLGKIFAFEFLKNFDYPYISKSITEFWRRWHISLSTWFREYIYIPLGGNKQGFPRQVFNMFVVWALTGLWYGASYNFILWGLYFFVILVIEKMFLLKVLKKAPATVSHMYTLVLIIFGWVIFYFEDMGKLWRFAVRLFDFSAGAASHNGMVDIISYLPIFVIAIFACTPISKNLYDKIKNKSWCWIPETVACVCGLLLCTASLVSSGYNPFLYFKF
ncbi:MAG: MBOAT family protein [Lachnospiraceae bacterium]|nr:MBOAT family protein [Lachnospiraceae bacterium]